MIKLANLFSYNQNLSPGLSAIAPGLHTYMKSCNLRMSSTLKQLDQFFARSHIETSVKGVLSIYSNGSASLNKMAVIPRYGQKLLKVFFSRTKKASRLNLGIKYLGLKVCQVCSNYDPRLTFDFLMARSNLHPYVFVWGKY